ncbi:MAG TPA: alpha-L-fucosidase [Candidatus Elarobacter sp.]|nr:alpha-L-fucosidase [Candidatus Elarobacter sp.]
MARTDAFNDAKFGLMISFGIYTVGYAEASWPLMAPNMWPNPPSDATYFGWASAFKPASFDARAWVQTALDAGARYLVPLTKHHDGFCMFDAPGTDFKSTNPAYANRDFIAELAAACSELNFPHLGLYYSPPDLHNPDYRDTSKPAKTNWWSDHAAPITGVRDARFERYLDTMRAHLTTLLTDPKYHVNGQPVFLLWFDGLTRQWIFEAQSVYDLIAKLSPTTLTDNRLYYTGDYITPEQFVPDGVPVKSIVPPLPGELTDWLFFTFQLPALEKFTSYTEFYASLKPVQKLQTPLSPPWPMPPAQFQPWETCMSMTKADSWTYHPDEVYKPVSELIQTLVQAASSGGNFLLNVGPKPDGTFADGTVSALNQIGAWLRVNGGAIYGTTFGPYRDAARNLYTTRKGSTVYLHVFTEWNEIGRGPLVLSPFAGTVTSVTQLDGGASLAFTQNGSILSISPPQHVDPYDTVLTLALAQQT